MSISFNKRFARFALLASLMAATRFNHAGAPWLPPDASWAVFFIAGFYLRSQWRWALALLLIEAIGIDYLAIRYYGVSNYCVTLAYWFIAPAYSVLWLGGVWLGRHCQRAPRDLVRLLVSLVLAVTLCYLLTGTSFYWLSGRVAHPSLMGWAANLTSWYGHFLVVSCAYVAMAALLHIDVTRRAYSTRRVQVH
jgi:hypothetical protein